MSEDIIRYEKDGIKITANKQRFAFHKNGLKIEIPMSVMMEFSTLLMAEHEDAHGQTVSDMGIHLMHSDTSHIKTRADLRRFIVEEIRKHRPEEVDHADQIADTILKPIGSDDQVAAFLGGYMHMREERL
jgi:hypothetical protein